MDRSGDTLEATWTDFDGYLTALEKSGSTINVATQVGHGTVRAAVLGMETRAPERSIRSRNWSRAGCFLGCPVCQCHR